MGIGTMAKSLSSIVERGRLVPTVAVVAVVLLAAWVGNASGGYFVSEWAAAAIVMAVVALIASVTGVLGPTRSRWAAVALGFFAAYTAWTFLSMLWSPNRGDAWIGAGQTLLYLLAFWIVIGMVIQGASRRWIFAASTGGTAIVAALILATMIPRADELFEKSRLIGTVGYYNAQAAFLLVSFWVAVYLASSRRVNLFLRGATLAGAVLCLNVAVLAQSRGALAALACSSLVYFALSSRRLRGLLALLPICAALLLTFPELNRVFLDLQNGETPAAALGPAIPIVWITVAVAGLYGLLWGLVDRRWRPSAAATRFAGGLAIASVCALCAFAVVVANERIDNPAMFVEQRWEAFKTNDRTGIERSRYLSASGQGRYTYWQVAWKDFTLNPVLGVGTHNYEATYYELRERSAGWVRQPHMLPLEVLAERGIVGGVLFFGFLATCLAAGLWKHFTYLSSEGKAQVAAATAAVAYWFVHSCADWFWQMPAVTLPAIVYLAMMVAPWRQQEITAAGLPARATGAILAVAAILAITPLYLADRYVVRSKESANPWMALSDIQNARRFNPLDPQLPQREAELAMEIGDWPRAEQAYQETIRLNPEHFAPYKLLAIFDEKRGRLDKARSLYAQALDLNPLDRDLNRRIDQLDQQSKPEKAEN